MSRHFTIISSSSPVNTVPAKRRKKVQFRADDDGLCLASEADPDRNTTKLRFGREGLCLANEAEIGMIPLGVSHGETIDSAMQQVYVWIYGDSSEKEVVYSASEVESPWPREHVVELPTRYNDASFEYNKILRDGSHGYQNIMGSYEEHPQLAEDQSDCEGTANPYSPGESFTGRRRGYRNIMGAYEGYAQSSGNGLDSVNMKPLYLLVKKARTTKLERTSWEDEKIPRDSLDPLPESPAVYRGYLCPSENDDPPDYRAGPGPMPDETKPLRRQLAAIKLSGKSNNSIPGDNTKLAKRESIDHKNKNKNVRPTSREPPPCFQETKRRAREHNHSEKRTHSRDSLELTRSRMQKSHKYRDHFRDPSVDIVRENRTSSKDRGVRSRNRTVEPRRDRSRDRAEPPRDRGRDLKTTSKPPRSQSRDSFSWSSGCKTVEGGWKKKKNKHSAFSNKADIFSIDGKLVASRRLISFFGR